MHSRPPRPPTRPGEKLVWEALERDLPEDCIVIHSSYVPRHERLGVRQIDLLVISPGRISILEVKDYTTATLRDGAWYGSDGELLKDPIEQSQSLKSVIRGNLGRHSEDWVKLPIESYSVLPLARANTQLPAHILDADSLRTISSHVTSPSGPVPVTDIANALSPTTSFSGYGEAPIAPESGDVRDAYALLVKQMCHGLNKNELAKLHKLPTGPTPRELRLPVCDTTASGEQRVLEIPLEKDVKGALVDQYGSQVLWARTGPSYYLTGTLRGPAGRAAQELPELDYESEMPEGEDSPLELDVDFEEAPPLHIDTEDARSTCGFSWVATRLDPLRLDIHFATGCAIQLREGGGGLQLRENHAWLEFSMNEGRAQYEVQSVITGESNEAQTHHSKISIVVDTTKSGPYFVSHVSLRLGSVEPPDHQQAAYQFTAALTAPQGHLGDFRQIRKPRRDIYSHLEQAAIGHNCGVSWSRGTSGPDVVTASFWPQITDYRPEYFSASNPIPSITELRRFLDDYAQHLADVQWNTLDEDFATLNKANALTQLAAAQDFVALLAQDPTLMEDFQRALLAVMGKFVLGADGWSVRVDPARNWRRFQLLFILAAAASSVDPGHADRLRVDVIEYPTGGGKTEAYLALAALTILRGRRREANQGDKEKRLRVLMRYPLRLLAAQQVQRASTMTTKLNWIVSNAGSTYTSQPVSCGVWAGRALTPNSDAAAETAIKKKEIAPLLTKCPSCGGTVGFAEFKRGEKVYKPKLVCLEGTRETCYLMKRSLEKPGARARGEILLDWTDETVYRNSPDFLVATLDKLAVAPWKHTKITALFARAKVDLVIQDELHMLDDELGSLEGLYQTALDSLIQSCYGYPAKIVAASATTKNTDRQVSLLYNRENTLRIPGPETTDQQFWVSQPGDAVKSITTGLLPSPWLPFREAQTMLFAAQAQAAAVVGQQTKDANLSDAELAELDAVWTNLVFFGSRPGLRDASLLLKRANVSRAIAKLSWVQFNRDVRGRTLKESRILEASSESSKAIPEIISCLSNGLGRDSFVDHDRDVVDVCLATSMIEVGVDIDRLGLMTFVGFPKETNSYIQASGRVGRKLQSLVYVLYRRHMPRDVSLYEDFFGYHLRRNDYVEPSLLSPFSPGAVRRALPGLVAVEYSLVQHSRELELTAVERALDTVITRIQERAGWKAAPQWLVEARVLLHNAANAQLQLSHGQPLFADPADLTSRTGAYKGLVVPLDASPGRHIADTEKGRWFAPTSLRSVAGEVVVAIKTEATQVKPHGEADGSDSALTSQEEDVA